MRVRSARPFITELSKENTVDLNFNIDPVTLSLGAGAAAGVFGLLFVVWRLFRRLPGPAILWLAATGLGSASLHQLFGAPGSLGLAGGLLGLWGIVWAIQQAAIRSGQAKAATRLVRQREAREKEANQRTYTCKVECSNCGAQGTQVFPHGSRVEWAECSSCGACALGRQEDQTDTVTA